MQLLIPYALHRNHF